jgi:hypothetical protein
MKRKLAKKFDVDNVETHDLIHIQEQMKKNLLDQLIWCSSKGLLIYIGRLE